MPVVIDDVMNRVLTDAGFGGADRVALAGDASRRRYEKLSNGRRTAILMISPPAIDPSLPRFIRIAQALRSSGISAPEVLSCDLTAGLAVVEDLGAVIHSSPDLPDPLDAIRIAVDLIPHYADVAVEAETPDAIWLSEAVDPAGLHYPNVDQDAFRAFKSHLAKSLLDVQSSKPVLSLRDYHAGNLTWCADRQGVARIGVLDFQDAFYVHPVYDLVSLLNDVRIAYAPEFVSACIVRFVDRTGASHEETLRAFAIFTIQRNTRILGIFSRLAACDRKTEYLRFMPRTWQTIQDALDVADVAELKQSFLTAFPAPEVALLQKLGST